MQVSRTNARVMMMSADLLPNDSARVKRIIVIVLGYLVMLAATILFVGITGSGKRCSIGSTHYKVSQQIN